MRGGVDVTVVAIGVMVRHAMRSAETLSEEGIEVEVVDPMTLFPLDKELILASVRKTGRLVILDEARATCSAASEIAAIVAEQGFASLHGPVRRVTVRSEEHTSELQSLMRISYAVFCLKKKTIY